MTKLHFLLLVFHHLSQRKCCAASYMMILEYHEKYGRRCNFSRRDQELYYLLSPGETRSRFSFYYSHVLRRDRDYKLSFSCFKTRTRNADWIYQGRAKKSRENKNSRWALLWTLSQSNKLLCCCSESRESYTDTKYKVQIGIQI